MIFVKEGGCHFTQMSVTIEIVRCRQVKISPLSLFLMWLHNQKKKKCLQYNIFITNHSIISKIHIAECTINIL